MNLGFFGIGSKLTSEKEVEGSLLDLPEVAEEMLNIEFLELDKLDKLSLLELCLLLILLALLFFLSFS